MKHSFYLMLQANLKTYENDLKALALYTASQKVTLTASGQSKMDQALIELGYTPASEVYFNDAGLPIDGVEWKSKSFDPISVTQFHEQEQRGIKTSNIDQVSDHDFMLQICSRLKDYERDAEAARLYLLHWRLNEDSRYALGYIECKEIYEAHEPGIVADAVLNVLSELKQKEISRKLDEMGYPDPDEIIFDNEGIPYIEWQCPEFSCEACYEAIMEEEAEDSDN